MWTDEPEFGERAPGRVYPPRPGAYAVLWDAAGERIAVVETHEGCFLPGGGLEAGESVQQALRREIAEEVALAVEEPRELGRAVELVWVPAEKRCFRKEGVFFTARAGARLPRTPEPDHAVFWLSPAQAIEKLSHESQKWVVRRVIEALRE
jgi:8-oxo-dGTP diphosphatase